MKLKEIKKIIEIPSGVTILLEDFVTVKGPKGETKRKFVEASISFKIEGSNLIITSDALNKKEKRKAGTIESHIKNMISGVKEGYIYKMKICSGHFPMNVSITGRDLSIKNFLGEKHPRTMKLKENVNAKIVKDEIILEGVNKEEVGQVAADIEQLTRIAKKDRRIFQDGIYITSKGQNE